MLRIHTPCRVSRDVTITCGASAALRHKSRFLDPSETRLQAEKKCGLSRSEHDFLIILGPERTCGRKSKAAAELAAWPVQHDTHTLTNHSQGNSVGPAKKACSKSVLLQRNRCLIVLHSTQITNLNGCTTVACHDKVGSETRAWRAQRIASHCTLRKVEAALQTQTPRG